MTRPLGTLLLATCLAFARPVASRAEPPQLFVPAPGDSLPTATPPAPLLVPGRALPADSTARTRAQKALDQYALGLGLEQNGAYGAAITAYTNASKLDRTLRGPNARIGALFVRVGEWGPAALAFAAEVELAPNDHAAARELGLALANLGDSTRAIRQLELLVRKRPRDAGIWQALGFAYGSFGRLADADRALRKAVALDARDADAWRDLGVVLGRRGRTPDARRAFERSLQLDPDASGTWLNLANLDLRAGEATRALAGYRRALERDTLLHAAYEGELRALAVLKREDERGAVYRLWLARAPEATAVRLEAIDHFRRVGRSDIAVQLARDGVQLDPKSSSAHLALATALVADGQWRAALETLRRSESLAATAPERERAARFLALLREQLPDSLRGVGEVHRPPDAPGPGAPR